MENESSEDKGQTTRNGSSLFCGQCGARSASGDDRFCRNCGAELSQQTPIAVTPALSADPTNDPLVIATRADEPSPRGRNVGNVAWGVVWGLLVHVAIFFMLFNMKKGAKREDRVFGYWLGLGGSVVVAVVVGTLISMASGHRTQRAAQPPARPAPDVVVAVSPDICVENCSPSADPDCQGPLKGISCPQPSYVREVTVKTSTGSTYTAKVPLYVGRRAKVGDTWPLPTPVSDGSAYVAPVYAATATPYSVIESTATPVIAVPPPPPAPPTAPPPPSQLCGEQISVSPAGASPIGRSFHDGETLSLTIDYSAPGCTAVAGAFYGFHAAGSPFYTYWCATHDFPYRASMCANGRFQTSFSAWGIPLPAASGTLTLDAEVGVYPPLDLSSIAPLEGFKLCYVDLSFDGHAYRLGANC